jgi:rhamnosyltransferase
MTDVIIPVYRPDEKLERLIERLNVQTVQAMHVFFMHTLTGTSEDDRVHELLCTAEHAVITELSKAEFDHGGTRNRAARLSEAEFILFLTQDAVPENEYLIENLEKQFRRETVAAAYGKQLPGDEVGIIEQYTRSFNYPEESFYKSKKDLERLGIKTYFCSNVCAMYRRSVYRELGGFVLHTIFNEDMIMASSVIAAGYEIAYAADARVVHAHKYTYRQQFSRNFDLAVSQRQYREVFDGVKSETEGIRLVKETAGYLLKNGKWYLLPDLVLQSGFKFLGYRFGKKYEKLPKKLVRRLSMNKAFWD